MFPLATQAPHELTETLEHEQLKVASFEEIV